MVNTRLVPCFWCGERIAPGPRVTVRQQRDALNTHSKGIAVFHPRCWRLAAAVCQQVKVRS